MMALGCTPIDFMIILAAEIGFDQDRSEMKMIEELFCIADLRVS